MGPRPLGRGKYKRALCRRRLNLRRWGRGLSAAERGMGRRHAPVFLLRRWGRGLSAAESRQPTRNTRPPEASMGPRPLGRGKDATGPVPVRPSGRRWGRGLSAAERVPCRLRHLRICARRWGRGLSAAESLGMPTGWRWQTSVDGAAASRPRKVGRRCYSKILKLRRWGRGLSAAESRRRRPARRPPRASMGPRPLGRGKRPGRPLR